MTPNIAQQMELSLSTARQKQGGRSEPEEVKLFSDNSEARCLADVQAGFADKVAGVQHVLHLLAHIRQLVRG